MNKYQEASDALDKLYEGYKNGMVGRHYSDIVRELVDKAQEQEKVLKIIKEKNVDIFFLRNSCDTVEEYNKEIMDNTMFYCYSNCIKLTQEEFNKIKEWLKNDK